MSDMGMIKVEVNFPEFRASWSEVKKHRGRLFQTLTKELKDAAATALNQLMSSEMSIFLGKPEQTGDKRNGYEVKSYALKGVGALELRIPIDRHRQLESTIIPKHERMDPRLREDLAVLHLAGISTRMLSKISCRVLGVQVGIMDGLPGLEATFKKVFPHAQTARCWVHAKRNALAKCPARYREALETYLEKVMYATSESQARAAFIELKTLLSQEAERAVRCLEKDLDSLLVHYRSQEKFWMALKTTNPIERVNMELKRRTQSMGTLDEKTLECLQAFTALRLEMNWRKKGIDSERFTHLPKLSKRSRQRNSNDLEEVLTTLIQ